MALKKDLALYRNDELDMDDLIDNEIKRLVERDMIYNHTSIRHYGGKKLIIKTSLNQSDSNEEASCGSVNKSNENDAEEICDEDNVNQMEQENDDGDVSELLGILHEGFSSDSRLEHMQNYIVIARAYNVYN